MNRLFHTCCLLMLTVVAVAQAPHGTGTYYQRADGKKGAELKTALYQILKDPSVVLYDSLWTAYKTTDARLQDDSLIIWDMYSDISAYSINSSPRAGSTPQTATTAAA